MKARLRGVGLALVAALLPAHAQQAVEKVERIEVTGSRIALSSDIDSPSPIAVIKAEDIRLEGFQSLELVLNNFPQFAADQGNRISNGATGTATANLRALGPARTLVLLNGRRMPAGSPFNLAPDLNQIPTALIQRVEVLTGGASAVYGSDAIAGVVNFILNDRFEGVQGEAAYSFYNHQQKNDFAQGLLTQRGLPIPGDKSMDGETGNVSLTLGGNFAQDKGNASVSFRYFKSQAHLQSDRDYSACALSTDRLNRVVCGGSSASDPASIQDLGFFPSDPTIEPVGFFLPTVIQDPVTGRIRTRVPGDLYNYAPLNYYQRPQERYGFNAFANYEIAPNAKLYGEFGYHDDHTIAQIAPTAIFFQEIAVRYENPLLNDAWRSRLVFRNADGTLGSGPGTTAFVLASHRNVNGGGRQDDLRHTSSREVVGIKGLVADHWDYDLYFQDGRVRYNESYQHDFSQTRIARALDVLADPATGAPVCASVLNGTDRNCVPYNLWALNSVTPAALAYIEVPAIQRALMTQQVTGGTVSANLGDYGIRMPGTQGGVEVAFGIERRTEKLDFEVDAQFKDLAGGGQENVRSVNGGFTVKELFGEVRVPVFDKVNFSGSFRRSDYDTGIATNTFGVGFNATPAKFMRLRGSYQQAVRAPNLNELFSPQFPGGYGLDGGDPCAGEAPARSLADCQRTGVTAAQYGRILQVPEEAGFPSTSGGNPALRSETAKTYTVGFVFTPSRDLSATIDYFDIKIDDTISGIDGSTIVEQCLATGDPFFCRLVTRDPASQALWYGHANVVAINQNIGKTQVAGADLAVNYRLRLPQGHAIGFDGLGTYLHKQSVEEYPHASSVSCAGLFLSACSDIPLPKWRHRLRVTWQPPWNFEVAATWRYIHSTKMDPSFKETFDIPPLVDALPAISYLDLAGSWNITKRVTLRGGVNNVADRDPPLVFARGFAFNGNTFAQVYDALGRHIFVSLTAKF